MAIHSSILAWKILWIEESGRLYIVHGVAKSWTQLSDQHFHFSFHFSVNVIGDTFKKKLLQQFHGPVTFFIFPTMRPTMSLIIAATFY